MNNFKRIVSLCLAGMLLTAGTVCCFTGCAGGEAEQTTAEQTDSVTETPAESTAAEETTEEATVNPYNSLDGKTVMFIGNSFLYYGGLVVNLDQKQDDDGMFKHLCQANGENTVVLDCTYGAHSIKDFVASGCTCSTHKGSATTEYNGCPGYGTDLLGGLDLSAVDYVFISEAGSNNSNIVKDIESVMARFPNPETRFLYVAHSYTYFNDHTNIINGMKTLEKNYNFKLVPWGKMVDDLIDGRATVENSSYKYVKNSFIVNKLDTHHPNPLSGYITALMCYCAVTGRDPVGQQYEFCNECYYGNGKKADCDLVSGYDAFVKMYYNSARNTNFNLIMSDANEMAGLQKLARNYISNYLVNDAAEG